MLQAFKAYYGVEFAIRKWELIFHVGVHIILAFAVYIGLNNCMSVVTKRIRKDPVSSRDIKNALLIAIPGNCFVNLSHIAWEIPWNIARVTEKPDSHYTTA
jgi:hypothetical protein